MARPNESERARAERIQRIAKKIGATKSLKVGAKRVLSPPELLGLQKIVSERLRSTGGRPTDPDFTIRRQIGFTPETWDRLQALARELSKTGKTVAPAQVAAFLIEQSIEQSERRTG